MSTSFVDLFYFLLWEIFTKNESSWFKTHSLKWPSATSEVFSFYDCGLGGKMPFLSSFSLFCQNKYEATDNIRLALSIKFRKNGETAGSYWREKQLFWLFVWENANESVIFYFFFKRVECVTTVLITKWVYCIVGYCSTVSINKISHRHNINKRFAVLSVALTYNSTKWLKVTLARKF